MNDFKIENEIKDSTKEALRLGKATHDFKNFVTAFLFLFFPIFLLWCRKITFNRLFQEIL